jgi:uncharacterized protein (TIGR02246 family)
MRGTTLGRRVAWSLTVALSIPLGVSWAQTPAQKANPDDDAIRANAEAFLKAFRAGDADALLQTWTDNGEYINDEGVVLKGRESLSTAYKELFAGHKPLDVQMQIEGIRYIGKDAAVEEGTFSVVRDEGEPAVVSRYSALNVREGGKWRTALLKEWPAETAAQENTVEQLAWLVGKWSVKTDAANLDLNYTWSDDTHAFIENRFRVSLEGKVQATGLQIIGRDPDSNEIHSWVFDSNGAVSEGSWTWDGGQWLIESVQRSPDGTLVESVNALGPIDADSFTWHASIDAQEPEGDGPPPIKVVRQKGAK